MKYAAVILIAAGTYFYLARQAPVKQAVEAVTAAPGQGTDFLKRPLDRTREVLQQARQRADDPALK
ncbi:MAG TPA: hypothetical protein VHY22_11325 [Chthoniobacteraceae bacterium]|nr:hypothetical protein [Chthoniobacteraceae bacterium]